MYNVVYNYFSRLSGDGWGECPAAVGSGDGVSPEECGAGSLELGGSSNSSTSSNPGEWAVSLDRLLKDPAGVAVYKQFLEDELGCSKSLDFFFACKGLGKQSPENLKQLLPLIWKNFIRKHDVPVTSKTYAILAKKIHENTLSADMFRIAQQEVFDHMMDTTYLAFLQSQYYVDQQKLYLQEPKDDSSKIQKQKRDYQSSYRMQTRMQDVVLGGVDYYQHLYSTKQMSSVESTSRIGSDSYLNHTDSFSSKSDEEFPLSVPLNSGNWSGLTGIPPCGLLSTVYENDTSATAPVGSVTDSNRLESAVDDLALDARLAVSLRVVNMSAEAGDDPEELSAGLAKTRLNLTSGTLAATMGQRAVPPLRPK